MERKAVITIEEIDNVLSIHVSGGNAFTNMEMVALLERIKYSILQNLEKPQSKTL